MHYNKKSGLPFFGIQLLGQDEAKALINSEQPSVFGVQSDVLLVGSHHNRSHSLHQPMPGASGDNNRHRDVTYKPEEISGIDPHGHLPLTVGSKVKRIGSNGNLFFFLSL